MEIPFTHRQSAHCENGVTANLLLHHGVNISEALVFGIGSGLFFAYLPFIRLNHLPLTTFRIATGGIMKRVTKRLGVGIRSQKFRDPKKAMDALDRAIEQGIPVGCRTGAYWLKYFPRKYRFHFNMHNLVAYGKKGDDYLISDPVFPDPVVCPRRDFMKARFAQGPLAPKGHMYYLTDLPDQVDFAPAIVKGIREVGRMMLKTPGPIIGVKGMRYLTKKIEKWPEKLGEDRAILYVGQLIRMQEEIGTGGAGFRFIYAAFLQEAAEILGKDELLGLSEKMTEIGDQWREFALIGSRICKGRASAQETYPAMAEILRDCADQEGELFRELLKIIK